MNCKHKNKKRLYKRKPTTWESRDLWECEDCGAILGIAQIKVKMADKAEYLIDKTKDVFGGKDE